MTGKGTFVIPGVQTVRRLSPDLRQTELGIECVTHQGIPLGVKGVVIFKVGDDFTSISWPRGGRKSWPRRPSPSATSTR